MKRYLLVFALIATFRIGEAQSNYGVSSLSAPSDNNSFLTNFGNAKSAEQVGVDLYTGSAKVAIPICDLESKETKIPISLEYVGARGIKVQDAANTTGLGWELNAGGSVSRVIRGIPDEDPAGYLSSTNDGADVVAKVRGTTPPDQLVITDPETDIYYVKTPFINFHFTFDVLGNAIITNGNGYKIIHNLYHLPVGTSSHFEIIDNQGNQYYFGTTTASQDNITTTTYQTRGNGVTTPVSHSFPITWHLDRISTFNGKDNITLNYTTGANYLINAFSSFSSFYYQFNPVATTLLSSGYQITPISYTSPKYLSSIVSSLGEVHFLFAFDRQDFTGVGRLTNIYLYAYDPVVKNTNTNLVRSYNLNYSYFGSPSSDPNQLRLCLNNISMVGTTGPTVGPTVVNSFDYNTTTSLPPRNSPQFDYWGYYNQDATMTADQWTIYPDQTNRRANLLSASADILTAVHNLTGGITRFQYELNTYYNGGNISIGGLRVNKITRSAPNVSDISEQFLYTDASGHSTGTIYGYTNSSSVFSSFYNILSVLDANYDASFNGSVAGINFPAWEVQAANNSPYNVYDMDGNFVGYSSVKKIEADGGYSVNNFTSFNTIQDIYSITPLSLTLNFWGMPTAYPSEGAPPTLLEIPPGSIRAYDYSYRRGILTSRTLYTSAGVKIKDLSFTYSSLSGTPTLTADGYCDVNWGLGLHTYEYYNTYADNYRLTQNIEKTYDQHSVYSYITKTINYTYSPNGHSINSITTTDSKGNPIVQNIYHADDVSIPMVTSAEQNALSAMVASNRTDIIVHQTDSKNGKIHQLHSSYNVVTPSNHVYLIGSAAYTGNVKVRQHVFTYDATSSNLMSTSEIGSNTISFRYGYNNCMAVASIINATSGDMFYEGFEETGNVSGVSHTGNSCYSGTYMVNFTVPDTRSYVMQWWSSTDGVTWFRNEQPYSGPLSLTGNTDDIRIFPKDSKISSTSYLPQIGV